MATQDIGPLGLRESEPVLFQWSWLYSFPTLPLWAIFLLLFALKANRHPRAWLILLPMGLVMLVWQVSVSLFSVQDSTAEWIGFLVEWGVLAWAWFGCSVIG